MAHVDISDSGTAKSGDLILTNTTATDQAFTLSWSFSLHTDGGETEVSGSLAGTLGPAGSASITPGGNYNLSAGYANTAFWIGTGNLGAQEFAGPPLVGPVGWTIDNTNIFVDNTGGFGLDGVETITYTYLTIPEPSTTIMLGTALIALVGVRPVGRSRARECKTKRPA